MKIENKPYNSNYFDKAIDLLKITWDFTLHFKNLKNSDVPYTYYLEEVLINCSYRRVIVNEKDELLGFIFAEMNEGSTKWNIFKLNTRIFFSTLKGNFGERRTAFSFFRQYVRDCKSLYAGSDFENEVYLLSVSPKAKGLEIGKKLINNYIKECRNNKVRKIGLQTASDCNYHFYDHMGFERESAIYTDMYEDGHEDDNFFIYTKEA
jgi:ribosomal protein S18 acetylase RimI-like enzyme